MNLYPLTGVQFLKQFKFMKYVGITNTQKNLDGFTICKIE